jgi:hypothetical protein
VLCWVLFSLVVVSIAIADSGYWLALIPTLLFCGSIAALILENLEKPKVLLLAVVGVSGSVLSLFI